METGVKGMLEASLIRLFLSTAANRAASERLVVAAEPPANQPYLSSEAEDPPPTAAKNF